MEGEGGKEEEGVLNEDVDGHLLGNRVPGRRGQCERREHSLVAVSPRDNKGVHALLPYDWAFPFIWHYVAKINGMSPFMFLPSITFQNKRSKCLTYLALN